MKWHNLSLGFFRSAVLWNVDGYQQLYNNIWVYKLKSYFISYDFMQFSRIINIILQYLHSTCWKQQQQQKNQYSYGHNEIHDLHAAPNSKKGHCLQASQLDDHPWEKSYL